MIKKIFSIILLVMWLILPLSAQEFELISNHRFKVSPNEKSVVTTAVDMFKKDLNNVSTTVNGNNKSNIVIATIGVDPESDKFLKKHKLPYKKLNGQWEAFKIVVLNSETLVVMGSDARGTAYGVLELSRRLGVSPWEWWADVTPQKVQSLKLPKGVLTTQKPSVQYRGIFLNDEDWCLVPWSSENFEPLGIKNSIGPKTYSKIFELLLRLRANTIWPAMHELTTPFYTIEGNKEAADRYGIVVGTSHCEPMMRNNAGEWYKANLGRFNFLNNRDNIVNYWSDRLKQVAGTETFMTVGMRGVHDGRMEGVSGTSQYRDALHEVFKVQKGLLEKYINEDVTKIPQTMILYKEVLSVYKDSLQVPEYVTLMWADDNHGYITNLSNAEEQKRKGGSGIYYHVSYWGSPHDYLWLCTTAPALIYNQMKRAWDHGAQKIWILNVGDIKPAEYDTEFFMDLAWDINSIDNSNINEHLENWAAREFGKEHSQEVASIMNEYYRLASIRRPEHMGFNRVEISGYPKGGLMPNATADMTQSEVAKRVEQYSDIENRVIELSKKIAPERLDAYYQLVEYPVRGASLMNKKFLFQGAPAVKAYDEIVAITKHYNKKIAGGKWDGMMSMAPRGLPVFDKPVYTHADNQPFRPDPKYSLVIKGSDFNKENSAQATVNFGLGHTYSATSIKRGSTLNYTFSSQASITDYVVTFGFLPMHPAETEDDLRVEVFVDNKSYGVHSLKVKPFTDPWRENIERNQALVCLPEVKLNEMEHILSIKALDNDIIVDKITIKSLK